MVFMPLKTKKRESQFIMIYTHSIMIYSHTYALSLSHTIYFQHLKKEVLYIKAQMHVYIREILSIFSTWQTYSGIGLGIYFPSIYGQINTTIWLYNSCMIYATNIHTLLTCACTACMFPHSFNRLASLYYLGVSLIYI